MKKIALSLFMLIMLGSLLACGSTAEIQAPSEESSILLATFEGTGEIITPTFIVEGTEGSPIEFEVKWEAVPEDAVFSLDVHFSSVNNPSIAGNPYKVMKGSIPVSFSPPNPFANQGEFVIEVIASNKCNWVVEIWQ